MEYKAYELGIKQVGEGKVLATLAKLGVRDRDGDVLRKGLVGGHQIVAIKPQHKWDHVNLGVADVYEHGDSMEASMEFNMNISSARDWWEAIRFSHEKNHRTQYSFGFEATEKEHGQHSDGKAARFLNRIELAECSPVLIGASVGSQTLSVKAVEDLPIIETQESRGVDAEHTSLETAAPSTLWHVVAPHHEPVDENPFEATRHYKRLKAGMAAGLYRRAFTVQWPGTIEAHKDSWGFLHHHVDDEGQPGAANLEACLRGMALLKGWDGIFLPDEVREEMHAHWAAHLRDAGVDVPDFLARDAGLTMEQELDLFLPRAWSISDRKERVTEMLIRMGKTPAESFMQKFDRLAQHITFLQGVAGQAGEAKRHLDDQEKIAQYAREIQSQRLEEEARVRATEQAELQASFERMRERDQRIHR